MILISEHKCLLYSLDTKSKNEILFLFSKLGLHLPHMIDSKNGKAKWDGDKGLLTVTAKMKREYDFVNF